MVDDDNNQSKNSVGYEERIGDALERIRVPYDVWTKSSAGSPVTGDLTPYRNVIWITGPSDTTTGANYGGTLTTQDVAAMKGYLDNGGGLLLSSVTAAQQLTTLDLSFLTSYLHCAVASYIPADEFAQEFWGVGGTDVGNGTRYQLLGNENPFYSGPILAPVNGGVPEFIGKGELSELGGSTYGIAGVSYSGSYQTLFLTFGLDVLNDGLSGSNWQPKDTLLLRALNFFAEGQATGVDDPHGHALPSDFALAQNYPNPFNPSTTISYTITANGRPVRATLEVLNMLGQRVTTLVDKTQPSGTYTVTWNGTDSRGNRVSSGMYLYRLIAGEESMTKKMVLLK